jgi:hypothetical protein
MDQGVLSFQQVRPQTEFLDEVWQFDPRRLEQTDGVKISQYAIALAQYLIYAQSQMNKDRAEIVRKKKFIEATIATMLQPSDVKTYGSKTAAKEHLIAATPMLQDAQSTIDKLSSELTIMEGIDKTVYEYIATLKRELTRRENELYAARQERRTN